MDSFQTGILIAVILVLITLVWLRGCPLCKSCATGKNGKKVCPFGKTKEEKDTTTCDEQAADESCEKCGHVNEPKEEKKSITKQDNENEGSEAEKREGACEESNEDEVFSCDKCGHVKDRAKAWDKRIEEEILEANKEADAAENTCKTKGHGIHSDMHETVKHSAVKEKIEELNEAVKHFEHEPRLHGRENDAAEVCHTHVKDVAIS